MKYSLTVGNKYLESADEVTCGWNRLGDVYDLVKKNPNRRYRILFPESSETDYNKLLQQVTLIKALTPNYTIATKDFHILQKLVNSGNNAYLNLPVTDWDTFSQLESAGVSDVLVAGPLGFQMNTIARRKSQSSIVIRARPAHPSTLLPTVSISDFYIRPEDLQYYTAIDYLEFDVIYRDEEESFYSLYQKTSFPFNLSLLIHDLEPSVPSIYIPAEFGEQRANCGQRCREAPQSCRFCTTCARSAAMMELYSKSQS
jgi:hypothetical protein